MLIVAVGKTLMSGGSLNPVRGGRRHVYKKPDPACARRLRHLNETCGFSSLHSVGLWDLRCVVPIATDAGRIFRLLEIKRKPFEDERRSDSSAEVCRAISKERRCFFTKERRCVLIAPLDSLCVVPRLLPCFRSRPFRINAGPVHSYALLADGSIKYLTELCAGDQVREGCFVLFLAEPRVGGCRGPRDLYLNAATYGESSLPPRDRWLFHVVGVGVMLLLLLAFLKK